MLVFEAALFTLLIMGVSQGIRWFTATHEVCVHACLHQMYADIGVYIFSQRGILSGV